MSDKEQKTAEDEKPSVKDLVMAATAAITYKHDEPIFSEKQKQAATALATLAQTTALSSAYLDMDEAAIKCMERSSTLVAALDAYRCNKLDLGASHFSVLEIDFIQLVGATLDIGEYVTEHFVRDRTYGPIYIALSDGAGVIPVDDGYEVLPELRAQVLAFEIYYSLLSESISRMRAEAHAPEFPQPFKAKRYLEQIQLAANALIRFQDFSEGMAHQRMLVKP